MLGTRRAAGSREAKCESCKAPGCWRLLGVSRPDPEGRRHYPNASQRTIVSDGREDSFAEPSDRYASLEEAIDCLLEECGFVLPPDHQEDLFQA